jgi:glutathione S-transferase
MTQIELYTARLCPFAMRVRLALAEKGVQASEIEIDPQNKPAWFVEMSPNGKVPLLRHGANLVWESAVICEYLDEVCSGVALLPQDPYARAQARIWVKFADDRLYARTEALLHSFDRSHHAAITAELADSLRVVEREAFAGAMREGPYWLGAEFSLADLAFYPWFEQVCVLGKYFGLQIPDECHRLRAWKEAVAARETVKTIGKPPEFYLAAYGRLLAAA